MSEATVSRVSPAIVFAVGVFTTLMLSAHAYFAQRLVLDTGLPTPFAELALLGLGLGLTSIFARPLAERRFGPGVGRVLAWPAHLWLGCCFYLLLGLGLADLVQALLGVSGLSASGATASVGGARTSALVVSGSVALIAALGARSALATPRVVRVEHTLPGWPAALDGYRIAQLSDIHVSALVGSAFLQGLVARCNALGVDLVAITGDLVDGEVHHYGDELEPLAALRALDGAFFVTGNHDHYSGGEPWVQRVEKLGITALRNRRVRIARSDASFELAGVDDFSAGRLDGGHGHDLDRALAGWDATTPLLLLAHDPRTFPHAEQRGVHLQLSGHTHGGQMWPFRFFVRLQTPHVAGIYQQGRSRLYVSRGTGFWGPPMRVLAPAEITEHVLRSAR